MITKTLSAVALAAVLATPAFAQSTTPAPATTPSAQPSDSAKPGAMGTKSDTMNNKSETMGSKSDTMGSKAEPMAKPDAKAATTTTPAMGATAAADKKPGFVQSQSAEEWRASKLIGSSVYGPDDKSIGDINDVILATDGGVKAAVVGVGGFLGMGEKSVAIPFESLNVQRKANSDAIDKITVTFTKEQLEQAPNFAFYQAPKNSTTGAAPGSAPKTPARPAAPANAPAAK